jgi:hypothetical protein
MCFFNFIESKQQVQTAEIIDVNQTGASEAVIGGGDRTQVWFVSIFCHNTVL